MKLYLSLLALFFISIACKNPTQNNAVDSEIAMKDPIQIPAQDGMEHAYFASGCFWCVEAVFESVKGVEEAVSGYSGGTESNPTYKQVSAGSTEHAEAVKVIYDPKVVSYETLVNVFFGSQDPTTKNRQGPDRGKQYRSIAFYQNDQQKNIIESTIDRLNKSTYDGKIVTEVLPFQKFWDAEDYHQDYERNHKNEPYIRSVSIPRLNKFKAKFPELLKENTNH
ncbi:peptide-methionine (S)-S-oxide reductase MsrA [Flavimarina sp. Hel_I_48]|uniref:peptide-methionine (S)-S-oxide reductase MsrA n=1 Tax=Flavimarina sp. Hel_I_48 TaxID=1392488 RepID=UPI0004DF2C52|nr:peptide-methionine (S)-S-oxide reductase MsrA [Flavimarina sp. Hel_I_48]